MSTKDPNKSTSVVPLKAAAISIPLQSIPLTASISDDFDNNDAYDLEPMITKRASTIMITNELLWFEDDYIKVDPLGEPGTFGMAFSCFRKDDKDRKNIFAVKQINKAKFYHIDRKARYEILQNMKNEIEVMRSLDHENIVALHEVYEDRNYIYLVMDYLSGGELFARISGDDHDELTEKEAANITKQILNALSYMQLNNICHLDLKPDNIMFDNNKPDAKIKLIDFGMAQVVPRLKKMNQTVGTPYYTAPEVLNGEYDRAADVWSLGIIVFCMLFGFPPFYVDTNSLAFGKQEEDAIFELIKKGFKPQVLDGYGPWFPKDIPISDDAQKFIAGMLQYKVADRMTVSECLADPWIRANNHDKKLPKTVFDSLVNFNGTCRFKILISKIFANKLDPNRYAQTIEVFKKWDIDGDGEITLEEFKKGMKETTDLDDDAIQTIFNNLDQDDGRTITIDELIVASTFNALVSVDERMYTAFSELDKNGDGTIEIDELKNVIKQNISKNDIAIQHVDSIINEIDINGDGKIDYEEFLHALHPQYNETVIVRDQSAIKHGAYGSFDQNQFNEFRQFLKKSSSKQIIDYHFKTNEMRQSFVQYRKQKKNLSNMSDNITLNDIKEEDDDQKYQINDDKNDNNNDDNDNDDKLSKTSLSPPQPRTQKVHSRPSQDLAKYNKPKGCWDDCVLL